MTPASEPTSASSPSTRQGNAWEVFRVALGLGCTSFGGPVAHLGYFERAYVGRRQWLTPEEFTGLVALVQLIPGPASSQLGYLIGLKRAGWAGAGAAWIGFTLPSALLMFAFALLAPALSGPWAAAGLHGLKLVAVAVVAQAVWSMGKAMCPDRRRTAIALAAGVLLLVAGGAAIQLAVLALGALAGMALCGKAAAGQAVPRLPVGARAGAGALVLFLALLAAATGTTGHSLLALAAIFYRSGALVFGGGHVVLPLLREALVPAGWLKDSVFLSGYGAAQAVPGPLFTFAAFLGATVAPTGAGPGTHALWSVCALLGLFLPGLLIAPAGLSVWNWLGHHAAARGALAGINASVVGILGAALYTPIWSSTIASAKDMAIAALAFFLLERWRAPPIAIVGLGVGLSVLSV